MRKKKTHVNIKRNLFQSVKGKILLIGILGIDAAIVIGLVVIISINRNANNSEVVSTVNEINILQAQDLANDASYQYYVDESYLSGTLSNLDEMQQKAQKLKSIAGSYHESIDSILDNVSKSKTNYNELKSIHFDRGYDQSIGKYQKYINSSTEFLNWLIKQINLRYLSKI